MRAALLGVLCGGCIIPYATPPLRGELGASSGKAFHVAAGTHLASGTMTKDQPFDVGLGWSMDVGDDGIESEGAYLEGSVFVGRTRTTRTAVGVRGELLWAPGDGEGAAVSVRIDHELYGVGRGELKGQDRCGFVAGEHFGTSAVGLYAQAGHAWRPNGDDVFTATAGVTFRLPSSAGIYVGVPFCK